MGKLVKVCGRCKEKKPVLSFSKETVRKDKLCPICRKCNKEYYYANRESILKRKNALYSSTRERVIKRAGDWQKSNPERRAAIRKTYNDKNRELLAEKCKIYRLNNKERRTKTVKDHYQKSKTKPDYYLMQNIRQQTSRALGKKDNMRSLDILGCTVIEFKDHIEKQFVNGMTWENRKEWHLDHIIPISSAKTTDERLKIAHYTNIQPLWAKDNLSKGSKLNYKKTGNGNI